MTRFMKGLSMVALLLGFFWSLPVGHRELAGRGSGSLVLFDILVCLTALLVIAEAVRAGKYFWAAGFVAIALLFNPVVPVALSRKMFLGLDAVCILTFLASLAFVQGRRILTIPSITNCRPRSESL